MPNSKSSESVNQVRPKSFHQQSKANKTIKYKQLEIFFVFEIRTESWNVKYLIDNEFVLQYM